MHGAIMSAFTSRSAVLKNVFPDHRRSRPQCSSAGILFPFSRAPETSAATNALRSGQLEVISLSRSLPRTSLNTPTRTNSIFIWDSQLFGTVKRRYCSLRLSSVVSFLLVPVQSTVARPSRRLFTVTRSLRTSETRTTK